MNENRNVRRFTNGSTVSLVLVPHWLEEVVKRSQYPLEAVLDVVTLKRILSQKDLSFYYAINVAFFEKLHKGLQKTFKPFNFSQDSLKNTLTQRDGSRPTKEQVDEIMTNIQRDAFDVNVISETFPLASDVVSLIPYLSNPENEGDALSVGYAFDVFYLKDDVYGVRFKRLDGKSSLNEQLIECYDNVIALLCASYAFEEVAKSASFQEFVALSRNVAE